MHFYLPQPILTLVSLLAVFEDSPKLTGISILVVCLTSIQVNRTALSMFIFPAQTHARTISPKSLVLKGLRHTQQLSEAELTNLISPLGPFYSSFLRANKLQEETEHRRRT